MHRVYFSNTYGVDSNKVRLLWAELSKVCRLVIGMLNAGLIIVATMTFKK
jgi:hypothetical protein